MKWEGGQGGDQAGDGGSDLFLREKERDKGGRIGERDGYIVHKKVKDAFKSCGF